MGNAASVDAPRKSSKAAQKLSKPLANSATAGLLDSNDQSDIIHRPASATRRRSSVPCGSASAAFPGHLGTESTMADDSLASNGASALDDYLSNSMFQYNHPRVSDEACELEDCPSHSFQYSPSSEGDSRQRSQSVGVVASSSRSRRMHRAMPGHIGSQDDYESSQLALTAPPQTASRSSVNYDLYTVGEPPFNDQPPGSESQFELPPSRRQSYIASYHPAPSSDAAAPIPHIDSDLSLYAPIRRRSLLTPGVATRPAAADFATSIEIRHSHLPTPTRCDTPESREIEFLSIPRSAGDPSLVPRAHTPCEADYKQTGAFKHGTLRIMNGSPTTTPAWETTDDGSSSDDSSTPIREGNYVGADEQVAKKQPVLSNGSQYLIPPNLISGSPAASTSDSTAGTSEQNAATYFLPELKLATAPFSIAPITGIEESPELQTAGKLADVQNQLFEDRSPEYYTDLLNIRFDHDANSRSCSPVSLSGKRKESINRSDSGVVASPMSEARLQLLSKADSGYSSSVSMRSLSLKRNRQQEIEKSRNQEETPQVPTSVHERLSGDTPMLASPTTDSPTEQLQASSPEEQNEQPPPVPEKDELTKTSKQVSPQPTDTQTLNRTSCLHPDRASVSETSESSHQAPVRNNPSTPASPLGTRKARRPGLLKRLLSGARIPAAGRVSQDSGSDVNTPSIPRTVQTNPHEHPKLPDSSQNQPTMADVQMDNSEINTGRGSMDHTAQDPGIAGRTGQDQTCRLKSNFRLDSISSTITRAASSVIAKNPIRKPTLTKTKPAGQGTISPVSDTPVRRSQHSHEASRRHKNVVGVDGRRQAGTPAANTGRSNSLSVPVGSRNPRIYDDALRNHLASQNEQHKVAFRRASITGQYPVSRAPPPISMVTRNMGNISQFRVPPPIRPHSTPRLGPPASSQKHGREGAQNYLYNYSLDTKNAALARRSSREHIYANPTGPIKAFSNGPSQVPIVTSIRASSVQPRLAEYQFPGGSLNRGVTPSREPSFDHSRRNSLVSQTSQQSVVGNRQSWSQSPTYDRPVLRHRSSYDGYHFPTRQNYRQDNGPFASLPLANGQTFLPDLLNGQHTVLPSRQHQQHGGHVSRGQLQHYGLDQYGSPVQYRALHSYNSSTYRGMPVRSG